MSATLGKEETDGSNEPKETQICSNFLNPHGERIDIHDVQIGGSHHIHVAGPGAIVNIDQSDKLQKTNLTGTTEDVALIQKKLKEWYKDLRLPMVSWMKGGSTNFLIRHCFIKLQLNMTSRAEGLPVELQNIFGDVEGTAPTRILIDSQPGFGKTTLAHKIINDWANGEKYVSHFDFAVLVTLRSLKNKSIENAVNEITKLGNNKDLDSWEIINNDKTLLVLDGLDEVGDENTENILKILYDTFNNKMAIIVTCRTGLFKLDEEKIDFVFGGASKGDKFWHKKITILGITDENRGEFLVKFIQVENKDQIIERIEEIIEPVNEMFKSPLLLILLVFVILNDQNVEIKNKTDLFKNLINCIIRRSASEMQVNLKPNFTIFDVSSDNEYFNSVYKFGKIAKDHVMNNDLQFECNDDTDSIYQMGFFIRHETQKFFGSIAHYEVFHLSVLEFVTAFFMWRDFLKNGKQLPNELLHDVNEICRKKGSTSLVLPFLFGLIGKDVKQMFIQLSQYYSMYSVNSRLMDNVFSECELSEDLSDVITKFVPVLIFAESMSVFTKNTILNKFLTHFQCTSSDLQFLTQTFNIKIFQVLLHNLPLSDNLDHIVNNIKCEHLILTHYNGDLVNYESMAKHLKMCVAMSTAYRRFDLLKSASYEAMFECINDGILGGTVIDILTIELPNAPIGSDRFASVIANVKIKHISMYLINDLPDDLDIIISTIATSSITNSIFLHNFTRKKIELDLSSVVGKGEKNWELLKINRFHLKQCDESVFSRDCIDTFEIDYYDFHIDVLRLISPRSLRCPYNVIFSAIYNPNASSWYGWDSVVELTLTCDCVHYQSVDFAHLNRFKRLEVVKICISDRSPPLSRHVNSLRQLKVAKLEIEWMDKFGVEFCSLISSIEDSIRSGEMLKSIRNIDIILSRDFDIKMLNPDKFDMNLLVSILDYSSKIRARVKFESAHHASLFFEKNFIDFSKFSVQCEVEAYRKSDVSYSYQYVGFLNYRVILTIQKNQNVQK